MRPDRRGLTSGDAFVPLEYLLDLVLNLLQASPNVLFNVQCLGFKVAQKLLMHVQKYGHVCMRRLGVHMGGWEGDGTLINE